jgi:hypothetical protein
MPAALGWLATARDCFADECGTLPRGLLTSAFALVVGLERVFHLDERNDVGFDEHAIPRWTRKFRIGKGYVTTRNESVSWCPLPEPTSLRPRRDPGD